MAKCFLIFTTYLSYYVRNVVAAEYVEAPFQKYSVVFTTIEQKNDTFEGDIFSMKLFNQLFECHLPTPEEIASKRNLTFPNILSLTDSLNLMPCLPWKQERWLYLICPHIIFKMEAVYQYIRYSLGKKSKDFLEKKKLQGYSEKGEKYFLVRSYTNGSYCNMIGGRISTKVRFFCRQSKEERVFGMQQLSPCHYSVHIYTSRVCTGFDFESMVGHSLHCTAPIDAKELVLKNYKKVTSPDSRQAFGINMVPKHAIGDIFFVANATLRQNDAGGILKKLKKSRTKDVYYKAKEYYASEIMSATMAAAFDLEVEPANRSTYSSYYYVDYVEDALVVL